MSSDPYTLRQEAERAIGEDRVPAEELQRLIAAYGPPSRRRGRTYAVVVAVSASSPEQAWELVKARVTTPGAEPEGIEVPYIGAAWEGIPEGTTEICTEAIELELTYPSGGDFTHGVVCLTPCE